MRKILGTILGLATSLCGAPLLHADAASNIQNLPSNAQYGVLTQHNDIARTGAATHEDILTPASVKDGRFGYLGSVPVEGKIYAQPLYVEQAAVVCPADGSLVKNANIAYVATLENIVYAIDVDRREVCWRTPQLAVPQPGGGLLGIDPQGEGGVNVGIVSTPVIDLGKSILYAVTRAWNGVTTRFLVQVLDTRTGAVVGSAEVASNGTNGCAGRAFQPRNHNNRPGLLLVNDKLFLAFGSTAGEDDAVEYHGFVFGFDVSNPAQPTPMPRIFCTTPNGFGAGIWMSGGGLASDGSSIYFMSGNGAYHLGANHDIANPDTQILNAPMPGEYPDSFVKLATADLAVSSSYTDLRRASEFSAPYNFGLSTHTLFWARERSDADLGSGGVLLLGNRVIGGGKDGRLDVLDMNGLSRVQSFLAFFDADNDGGTSASYSHTYDYRTQYYGGPNIHGGPVAWDVRTRAATPYVYVYGWSEKDFLKRFAFVPDLGSFRSEEARDATPANPAPTAHGSIKSEYKSMPGGMLSLSANGTSGGIVWAVVEEPYAPSRGFHERCSGSQQGRLAECAGCFLSNGKFAEYCDATRGYVAGRLYAFAADDNGAGSLPVLWGDRRSTAPNNRIQRYSKFTAPTIAHGKVIVATGNDEVRFYGLRPCAPALCNPPKRRMDDLVAAWNDAGAASLALWPSDGANFEPHTAWKPRNGGWSDSIRWLSGDFDGDGSSDVAAVWNDGGMNTLTVRLRRGGASRAPEHWAVHAGGWMPSTRWLAGDFDGDGLSDIAAVWNDGGMATFAVYRSEGTRFEQHFAWAVRDGGWGDSIKWVSGDFDGDGLSDIAAIWNDGGTNTLTVRQSTGSSFRTSHWDIHDGGWMDTTQWLAGDFDGDGAADIAAAWNDGGSATFAVYRSTRVRFATHTQWKIRDGGWGDSIKWVSGDFNGDGLSDIAAIWNDGGSNTLTVRQSTATTFTTKHWKIRDGGWMASTSWCAGRFR